MSRFDFLDDEVNEAKQGSANISKFDRSFTRKPPTSWGAAQSKSRFEDDTVVGDQAGPNGGGGGGGGPSLPFRIREVLIIPKAIGTAPVFSVAKPKVKE